MKKKHNKLACVTTFMFFILLGTPAFSEPQTEEQKRILEVMRSLNWVKGPQQVQVGPNATYNLPQGYVFLNPAETKRFMELMHNPSSGSEYYFSPQDMRWMATFHYVDTGYVKDDEKIDADALLESLKQGTEEGNKERRARGWETLSIAGWKYPPHYDTQTKRLEWAIDARDSKNNPVINFNTRILGRHGVTSATLVVDPAQIDVAISEFKTTLKDYEYVAGNRYQEFVPGDKVAEYGLAALVAGGTAAALVKTGAAKWLWKLLGVAGIAALAGLKALFGRKKA